MAAPGAVAGGDAAGSGAVYRVQTGAPERGALIGLLARAFASDAHIDWLLPASGDREAARAALFSLLVDDMGGQLYATADQRAAALWFAPGEGPELWRQALFFQRLVVIAGPWRAVSRGLDLKRMDSRHPPAPHYYLQLLGVDPGYRRQGHGRSLLVHLLAKARETVCPVYLETSSTGNVDFYASQGFAVCGESRLTDGLQLWSMTWEPAARL